MSTHTAGPWVAVEQPNGPTQITQGELDGPMICEFPYGIDTDMDRANAALIMAAPELLAALTDVALRIKGSEFWWMDEPSRGGFDLKTINAAIAKATTS